MFQLSLVDTITSHQLTTFFCILFKVFKSLYFYLYKLKSTQEMWKLLWNKSFEFTIIRNCDG